MKRTKAALALLYLLLALLWPTGRLLAYRDLETGVFLTRDPAGFVDGPNLYAYVRQNPWSKWDPEGLLSDGGSPEDARMAWDATRGARQAAGYFAAGMAQGVLESNGASFDNRVGSHDMGYRSGRTSGHMVGLVQGAAETVGGGGMFTGGAAAFGAGTVATAGSGGVLSPVSVPAAVVGGVGMAAGAAVTGHGVLVGGNSVRLLADDLHYHSESGASGGDPSGQSAREVNATNTSRPKDGSSMPTDKALDEAQTYLGEGHREVDSGVFISKDGKRLVRMTDSDLAKTGNHAGAPHMNFEEGKTITTPNLNKPDGVKETFKTKPGGNSHVYLPEEK